MTHGILRLAASGALLASLAAAQKLEVDLVDDQVLKERLASGAVPYDARQARIEELFHQAGCPVEELRVDKTSADVICALPGQTNAVIAVGGHFDFVTAGTGIVDDWSGASMLASLYQALKIRPRRHTFLFIAFAAEEKGLVGSSRYVRNMTREQRARVRAFVNLECLGLTPPKVWLSRATPALVARLDEVAGALHVHVDGVNVERVGDDDSHPFLSAQIPVITIHSLTQDTFPILHSKRDRMEAIHFDDYYAAFKLVSCYLAYLDVKLD